MRLGSVKKESAFEAAVAMIGRYIRENKLGEGMRLPPETELAEQLGVSRNIVREALQHYRTLGIITSAPKTGASIAKLLPENPYGNYLPFLESAQEAVLPELVELRYVIETGAARFMIAGVTLERLAKLEALAAELDRTAENDRRLELDSEFHAELLRLPGNSLFDGLIPLVVDFFRKLRPEPRTELSREQAGREHNAILAALRNKDADELQRLLGRHIENYLSETDGATLDTPNKRKQSC